jgi:hypothetical protein
LPRGKRSKDRTAVLTCSNMDGTKAAFGTGKSEKPRRLKKCESLPCTYRHMSNVWMTCALLRIFNLFGPKNGSQKQKNTVFLHQCGTQSVVERFRK